MDYFQKGHSLGVTSWGVVAQSPCGGKTNRRSSCFWADTEVHCRVVLLISGLLTQTATPGGRCWGHSAAGHCPPPRGASAATFSLETKINLSFMRLEGKMFRSWRGEEKIWTLAGIFIGFVIGYFRIWVCGLGKYCFVLKLILIYQ